MKIYCSGIGGIGLSSYASLQKAAGHDVRGSDRADSALIHDLRSQGIEVFLDQDGSRVSADIDLFVYSEAVPADAPERRRATELGIPQRSYFLALGELSRGYRVIAVCGTHGKSSTTAMAIRMLTETGRDPTAQVGTKLRELGGRNWRTGKSDLFVVEACEYRRSFHALHPSIILMTTCDGDHFDAYDSVEEYQQAYVEFLRQLPMDGVVITHMSDPDCATVARRSGRRILDADSSPLPSLQTPGRHMQQNAQLVLTLADHLGIAEEPALTALAGYSGAWRRMEVKGTYGDDVTVIDDYGHHPREIEATLSALKEAYKGRRLVCVFQPHTHDRTMKLYDDFVRCFSAADLLLIPNVYVARSDIESRQVDLDRFCADIEKASGVRTVHTRSLDATERMLRTEMLLPRDLLVCMGAGDVTTLSDAMTVEKGEM